MADFLQNLRMAGIFNGPQPFGMPDLSAGQADPSVLNGLFGRLDDINSFKRNLINRQIEDTARDKFQAEDAMRHPGSYPAAMSGGNRVGQIGDAMQAAINNPGIVQPGLNYQVAPSAASNANPIDVFRGYTPMDEAKMELQKQALMQKGDIAENKNAIDQAKVGISQQRANIYDFKAKNPGMKIVAPKGGNFQAIDPITGKTVDTGIDTGTYTDEEKQKITGEQRMGEIEARGNIQRDIQGQRNEGNLAGIAARIQGQQDINAAKPNKAELPTQTKVRQNNAARELANTRPDLAPFIQFDPNGNFTIQQPGSSFFTGPYGPNPKQQKELQDYIFGSGGTEEPTPTPTPKPKAKTSTTPAKTPSSKYKVSVED
jgi:hypothetical protein